jgi:hypothetical protein
MKKILATLVLFVGFQAHAAVLLEPFLGYNQSTLNTTMSGTDTKYTNTGMEYGARIGYKFTQGFWIAGEYTGGSGKSKPDTAGATDNDYANTTLGAVFGYDYSHFRFWAGYGFSDKSTIKQTGQADADYTGTSMKVGLGFRPTQIVSINFEYIMPKYTKVSQSGTDYDVSTLFTKFDISGMALSVSFPFDLGK